MNERIKELWMQAEEEIKAEYEDESRRNRRLYNEIFLPKFAQLIVRECDHLIQQQVSLKYKDGWEQDGITDDWAYGHYTASILSRAVIKRHFGVEE